MPAETVRLPYADRAEAGRVLAERLVPLRLRDAVVLALPRGGVPVGREVAQRLSGAAGAVPLEVLVTRKIGYPRQPELGVGAITEDGPPVFDARLLERLRLTPDDLAATVRAERAELARRTEVYRGGRPLPELTGRDMLVVDDGLATGSTARAALAAVARHKPARLVLAVPVGAAETVDELAAEGRGEGGFEVVVPVTPAPFRAVGRWYRDFDQLTDADVIAWLGRAAGG
ncbi:phosphoribosyltransferase [Actinomadura hibisca]|uniref:phosphoribosyltransferase n=1 Tax=Actinomadura hibisca TaxID=68565 RepID=UPI00082A5EA4|nr:phosphoribosyltransferase family protein [Actinomadura hibisca]